jgi:hypothetical protein
MKVLAVERLDQKENDMSDSTGVSTVQNVL